MDADGHFSVHKSSKKGDRLFWNETYSPRIGLGQVTKVVPELLRKTSGGTTVRVEQRGGRNRPLFRWLATNKRAVRACACLLPYLRILPHYRALRDDAALVEALRQELRAGYVVLTRPRERVFLACCRTRERGGTVEARQPSPGGMVLQRHPERCAARGCNKSHPRQFLS
jgi:hypothetical protein